MDWDYTVKYHDFDTPQIKSPQFGKALQALDTSKKNNSRDGIKMQEVRIYLWYVFIYTSSPQVKNNPFQIKFGLGNFIS